VWAAWSVWSPLARGVLGVRGDVCLGLFGDGLGGDPARLCRRCHAWVSEAGGIGRSGLVGSGGCPKCPAPDSETMVTPEVDEVRS